MGSWNGTCGISQLPIVEGDDVALFILKKENPRKRYNYDSELNMGEGGFVHSNHLYKPICLPIFGKYADYGVIDNINDYNNTVLKHLQSLIPLEYVETKNLKDFIRRIERNKVENYSFMVVHKELYNQLVDYTRPKIDFFTNDKGLGDCFKDDAIILLELMKENNLRPYDFISKDLKTFDFISDERILNNKFRLKTEEYLQYYREPDIYDEDGKILNIMIDFLLFIEVMDSSRKLWIPQAGAGSQDEEYKVAELIGDFAKEKRIESEVDDDW